MRPMDSTCHCPVCPPWGPDIPRILPRGKARKSRLLIQIVAAAAIALETDLSDGNENVQRKSLTGNYNICARVCAETVHHSSNTGGRQEALMYDRMFSPSLVHSKIEPIMIK